MHTVTPNTYILLSLLLPPLIPPYLLCFLFFIFFHFPHFLLSLFLTSSHSYFLFFTIFSFPLTCLLIYTPSTLPSLHPHHLFPILSFTFPLNSHPNPLFPFIFPSSHCPLVSTVIYPCLSLPSHYPVALLPFSRRMKTRRANITRLNVFLDF